MDEYGDIQFVERNANQNDRYRHNSNQHRTFVAHVPRTGFQAQPQHGVVYAAGPSLGVGGCLGRMSTGQVIDMVAQVFAALMPLPAAPVATSDPGTDVPNLILYQSSLAQYAKRDEQVRTLGNLITKLVG